MTGRAVRHGLESFEREMFFCIRLTMPAVFVFGSRFYFSHYRSMTVVLKSRLLHVRLGTVNTWLSLSFISNSQDTLCLLDSLVLH